MGRQTLPIAEFGPITTASGNQDVAEQGVTVAKFENVAETDRYREARERLADRAAIIRRRTEQRLTDVQRQHDLTWRLLLASQRKIKRLSSDSAAPTATEFWESTALPQAAALTTAANLALETNVGELENAVGRFCSSVGSLLTYPAAAGLAGADVAAVLHPIVASLDEGKLDHLGRRWQRRLRRHATARSIRKRATLSAEEFDEVVEAEELILLNLAPWVHGDRLLSAFEIAHAEIRASLRQQIRAASLTITKL